MDLGNRVASTGSSVNQTSVPRKNTHTVGRPTKYGAPAPLKQISVNQTLKGEVTDLRNNEVTVTLDDNTVVTGRLEHGTQLSIGDTAAFQVEDVNPRIVLRIIPKSETALENSTVNKALEEAGLPKNEKNQAIVRELMNNNMPINKQSIQTILQQAYNFKGVSIQTLVLLNKHHIPVNETNALQFEHYRNMEHQLTDKADSLSRAIPELLKTLAENSPSGAVCAFGNKLLSILTPENTAAESLKSPDTSNLLPEMRQQVLDILDAFHIPVSDREALLNGSLSLRDLAGLVNSAMDSAYSFDMSNASSLRAEMVNEAVAKGVEPDLDAIEKALIKTPKTMEVFDDPAIKQIFSDFNAIQSENHEIGALLSGGERSRLLEGLKDFSLPPAMADKIGRGEATTQEVLSFIKTSIPFTPPNAAASLFAMDAFQTIFKSHIMGNWTISPKELEKEKSVDSLYSKMYSQVNEVEQFLKTTLGNTDIGSSLSGQAQDMRQNMDFMQTLNQMFSYVQLPLKLQEQNVHSELYVYTKKRDMQKDPSNISVLLHLDMEKLGPMDIHLSLHNNQVISKFYVADKNTKALFSSHMEELSHKLMEKGYYITTEFTIREKEVDIVKDFMEKDMPASSLKRYTFDIRA